MAERRMTDDALFDWCRIHESSPHARWAIVAETKRARSEETRLKAENERLREALGKAESALSVMTCAFDWGTWASVGAGVASCKQGLEAVRAALSSPVEKEGE